MIDAAYKFDHLKPRSKAFWGIFLIVLMALAVFELTSALNRGSGAGATSMTSEDQYTSEKGDSIGVEISRNSSSPMHTHDTRAPTMLPSAISPSSKPSAIFISPSTMQPCPPLFRKTRPKSNASLSLPPLSPSSSYPMMRTDQLRPGESRQPTQNS